MESIKSAIANERLQLYLDNHKRQERQAHGNLSSYAEPISKVSKGKLAQLNLAIKFCFGRLEEFFQPRQEHQNTQENSQYFYYFRHTDSTLRYILM